MTDSDWGYAVDADGNETPLKAPPFSIPEEEREYVPTHNPGIVLWTRNPFLKDEATE